MDGLKPVIREKIAPHVSIVTEAQIMVAKVDFHVGQGSLDDRNAGSGFWVQKTKMGNKNKGKGHVGMVVVGSSSEDAAFVLLEKKKLEGL